MIRVRNISMLQTPFRRVMQYCQKWIIIISKTIFRKHFLEHGEGLGSFWFWVWVCIGLIKHEVVVVL
jgi:hypothetical protein